MKRNSMCKKVITLLLLSLSLSLVVGCSTPEEKAQSFYKKGMALVAENPEKAKLEFQSALQNKKNMTEAMYGLALVAERQSDWKSEFVLLNNVLEQDPNHLQALIKRGQLHLVGGKVDKALIDSNKALAINKNEISALTLHAAVMLKLQDKTVAIDFANKALKLDANNADALIVLATERLMAQDYNKALAFLNQGLAVNPKNLVMYLIKVSAYDKLNKVEEAQTVYQTMLAQFPKESGVRKSYIQFLLAHKNNVEAEKQIRKIALDAPNEVQPRLDVVSFMAKTQGINAGVKELESLVKSNPKQYEFKFALIELYQAVKNQAAADQLLKSIVSEDGDHENGLKAKGIIAAKLMHENKKDEVQKLITEILQVDKRNEQALLLKANLELGAKNFEAAIIDLRSILGDTPNSERALMMLAVAHELAGSPALAEEQYVKAFKVSKYSPQVGVAYAAFLNKKNQSARADKVFQDILKAHPDSSEAFIAVANEKMRAGDLAGAQALAEQAKKMGIYDALADQVLGLVFAGKQDMQSSIAAFKRAHDAAPNNTQTVYSIVQTYLQFGKTKEANEFIHSVLASSPNNIEAQLMSAQLLMLSGDYAKSIAELEQLLKNNPKLVAGYQSLASAYAQAKRPEEAIKTLNTGIAIEPKNVSLNMALAAMFEGSKQYDQALNVYEYLLKDNPNELVLMNNIASLMTDHKTDKASLDRAYNLAKPLKETDIPQYLDTYGWASYKVGKLDEAELSLTKAIEKMPKVAVFQYHLAKIYIAKSDKEKAKAALKLAVSYGAAQQLLELDEANQLMKQL